MKKNSSKHDQEKTDSAFLWVCDYINSIYIPAIIKADQNPNEVARMTITLFLAPLLSQFKESYVREIVDNSFKVAHEIAKQVEQEAAAKKGKKKK